ncbi:hypothetical protein [Chitinophaga sp. MM2321]|uniref:hypothetical protein n=1 Tax=Chitinophaga sp. MM2321 TaxID=3137178 RepID=UPI0032D59F86
MSKELLDQMNSPNSIRISEKEDKKLRITKFLNKGGNSTIREVTFRYGLMFDLKLASASMERHLKIYEQEVDNEGCDIIIEDQTGFSRKIQLKSIFHSKTRAWKVHKSILRPAFSQMEDYAFDTVICPNSPGGVILIEASLNDLPNESLPIKLNYSYTDINIINLISLGVIQTGKSSALDAKEILHELKVPFGKNIIEIKKSLFLQLNGSLSLIKVMGFNQDLDFVYNSWKFIQTNLAPSQFYRTEIRDYSPYPKDFSIIDEWNRVRKNKTQGCLKNILGILSDIRRKF